MVAARIVATSMKLYSRKTTLLLVTILLIGASDTLAQSNANWEFAKGDEYVQIYYRTLPTGNVEFKGVTTVNASVTSLISLFADLENMPNWVYRTKSMIKLKQVSKDESYVYATHSMPFPFKERDSVILSKISKDPVTHEVTIHGKGKPQYIAEKDDFVRVQAIESFWHFTPLGNEQVQVTFQGHGEPGGSIPSSIYRSQVFRWLVEMYLWRLPYTTLSNMRTEVLKARYQADTATNVQ